MLSRRLSGFLALLLVLAAVRPVAAHALGAECKIRGGRVELEAYYDDDTPGSQARVVVQDEARKTVAEGKTDDKGMWNFPLPPPGRYRVRVDAGAGHAATVTLTVPGSKEGPTTSGGENGVPPAEDKSGVASDGPTRTEFTRFPLGRVALGLAVIGLLSVVLCLALRPRRVPQPPD